MRQVRLSRTFLAQLDVLLEQGYPRFGERVVTEKRDIVFDTINLSRFPVKPRDPLLGLHKHSVAKTPFVVIYDFDASELRVHFIFHKSAHPTALDPASAEW